MSENEQQYFQRMYKHETMAEPQVMDLEFEAFIQETQSVLNDFIPDSISDIYGSEFDDSARSEIIDNQMENLNISETQSE